MQLTWSETQIWVGSHARLLLPFLIAVWISWGDLRTRKIPNYLTFSAALAGLAFNFIVAGWGGLVGGILGLFLGFGFLILPYILGGMGAGDVKALAALGAWLGPKETLYLFCYMGLAGGLMALVVLAWKGVLWQKFRWGLTYLQNLVLCQDLRSTVASTSLKETTPGIPYGVAIALGMGMLLLRGGG